MYKYFSILAISLVITTATYAEEKAEYKLPGDTKQIQKIEVPYCGEGAMAFLNQKAFPVSLKKKGEIKWMTFEMSKDEVVMIGKKGKDRDSVEIRLLDSKLKPVNKEEPVMEDMFNRKLKKGTYYIRFLAKSDLKEKFSITATKFTQEQTKKAEKEIAK